MAASSSTSIDLVDSADISDDDELFFNNTFAHTGKEFTIAIKLILSDPYYIR